MRGESKSRFHRMEVQLAIARERQAKQRELIKIGEIVNLRKKIYAGMNTKTITVRLRVVSITDNFILFEGKNRKTCISWHEFLTNDAEVVA